MQPEKSSMIEKLEHARGELNSALEQISPEDEIFPTWKVKHLLDHITGWDELVATTLNTHSAGGTPERVVRHGIDYYNAQSVEQRKELTLEQSRKAYDQARAAVIKALQDMPDDRLDLEFHAPWGGACKVADVMKIFTFHELEHAKQLGETANLKKA